MIYVKACQCGEVFPGDLAACPKCHAASDTAAPAPISPLDYAYDVETYPNYFCLRAVHIATDTWFRFEISDRVNEIVALRNWLDKMKRLGARMVGYNNVGFDYPVVHFILSNMQITALETYSAAMNIINSDSRFGNIIWERDRYVEQLDLYRVHHFDNMAKATGLKALEFAMRMDNIEDLPFPVGKYLTDSEKDTTAEYCDHDVKATALFYARSLPMTHLREKLGETIPRNFMNMSLTKIGETILVYEMEKAGIVCYDNGVKRQTIRGLINLADCILHYVSLDHPEFARVKDWLASQTISETKGVFKGLVATVDGLEYSFGTGGLHASVENKIIRADETTAIVDVDVSSFYPNLAIMNKLYPAHLGVEYCTAYEGIYHTRKTFKKGSPENAAYKEALNASYGNSNNQYSVLYDPQYTMSTTINGQLSLCMLIEQLIKTPDLYMIQANTDGVTFSVPRAHLDHVAEVCKWWESVTRLELEQVEYSMMAIRDVNSYLAVKPDGKVKRIGAYGYVRADEDPGTREKPYHKDTSALVVAKAAEAALVYGRDPGEFIRNHPDDFDFMLRAKAPRGSSLVMRWADFNYDQPLPNTVRYAVTVHGGQLVKTMPPTGAIGTWKRKAKVSDTEYCAVLDELAACAADPSRQYDTSGVPWDARIHTGNKSTHEPRETSIQAGRLVTECNNIIRFDRSDIDYDWYIAEALKLIEPLTEWSK